MARASWKPAPRKLIGPRVLDFKTLKESVWQESAPYTIPHPTSTTSAIVVSSSFIWDLTKMLAESFEPEEQEVSEETSPSGNAVQEAEPVEESP